MKKVVLASLLAVAGAVPTASVVYAQDQAAAAPAGQIQMSPEEYQAYQTATQAAQGAAQAAAYEAYLKAYPNSAVKLDVLNKILYNYTQVGDQAKIIGAADNLLAVDPGNARALVFEVYYKRQAADALTDPAAKVAALDKVVTYASQGLSAPKPKGMADADFAAQMKGASPIFLSAEADDSLSKKVTETDPAAAKKDNDAAIATLKTEIDGDEPDTEKASPVLQDVYVLSQAYYTATPPDFLNCAWYATRAAAFAPDAFKPPIVQLGTYCYKKYHGKIDGYDAMQAAVKTMLDPTPDFLASVTPAPKPADMVHNLITTTPDLATLALGDKETALQYGTKEDADKVFDSVKGKSVEFPDVTVVSATADQLVLIVSDDATQAKTPDFTFKMKEPLKTVPNPGDKITVDGTYDSYTSTPLMITMTDGTVVPKKAAPKPAPKRTAPVHHTTPH